MEIQTHKLLELVLEAMSDMDNNPHGTWEHGYGAGMLRGFTELAHLLGDDYRAIREDIFKSAESIRDQFAREQMRTIMRNEEKIRPQLEIKNGGKQ